MKKTKLNLKQKGFTLVETLIVSTFAVSISAAVISGYVKQKNTSKASNQVKAISSIDKEVANFATTSSIPTFNANINTAALINSNIIPTQYVNAGNIVNEFGGQITVAGASTPTNKIYTFTITGLPQYACSTLAIIEGNRSWGVTVNGATLKINGSTAQINESTATGLCLNPNNTVILTKRVPIPVVTVATLPEGIDGQYQPTTFRDLNPTLSPAVACPGGSTNNGYSCACAANEIWNGQACVPSSIRYRIEGTTVGGGKMMEDYLAGTMDGTPAPFDTVTKSYTPTYLYNATNPDPKLASVSGPITPTTLGACSNGTIFNATTNTCENTSSTSVKKNINTTIATTTGLGACSNGLIWNATTNACETPKLDVVKNISGTLVTTPISISSQFDGVKFKTCVNGSASGTRCTPTEVTDFSINPTKTNKEQSLPTIALTESLLPACINGQVSGSSGCSCPAGQTLNSVGLCQASCSSGKIYKIETGSCACPTGSYWDSGLSKCKVGVPVLMGGGLPPI